MTIDWITVSAQIVNFLVLVWLLKHFLYRPVLDAMDRRERRIADRLEDARSRERQAAEDAERYQDKTEALEDRRAEILEEARQEAEDTRRRLLDEARQAAAQAREEWQQQVREEKRSFLDGLRRGAAGSIQGLARKALGDLADSDLEERIIDVFLARLGSLDSATRAALAGAGDGLRIASSFELAPAVRSRLTRAIHEHVAEDLEVDYGRSDDLLCGIAVSGGGRRVGWSLADYLEELDERIEDAFAGAGATRD